MTLNAGIEPTAKYWLTEKAERYLSRNARDVLDFSAAAAQRAADLQAAKQRHPATVKWNGTARALVVAAALINTNDLPPCDVEVNRDGTVIVLDWSRSNTPAGDLRQAAQALGLVVEENAAEDDQGCAAVELRAAVLADGIVRVLRAVVPVPAEWAVV